MGVAVVRSGEEVKVKVSVEKEKDDDVMMNLGDFESFPKLGRIRVPKRGRSYYNWRLAQIAAAEEKKEESTIDVDQVKRETPVEEAQHKESDGGESSDAVPEKQSLIAGVDEETPVEEAQKLKQEGEKQSAKELENASFDGEKTAAAADKQSIDDSVVDEEERERPEVVESTIDVDEDEDERETPVEEDEHKESSDGVEEKTLEASASAAPSIEEKAQQHKVMDELGQKSNDVDGKKQSAKLEDAASDDDKTVEAAAENQSIDDESMVDEEERQGPDEESWNDDCILEEEEKLDRLSLRLKLMLKRPINHLMNKTSSTESVAERQVFADINDVDDEANYTYYDYEVLFGTIPTTLIIPITPNSSTHLQQEEQEQEQEREAPPLEQDFLQPPLEEADGAAEMITATNQEPIQAEEVISAPHEAQASDDERESIPHAQEPSEADAAAEMITTTDQVEKETDAVSAPLNSTDDVEQGTTQETTHQPQASDDERETSSSEGGGEKKQSQVQKVEEEEMISFGGNNYDQHFPKIEFNARITKRERRGQQHPR